MKAVENRVAVRKMELLHYPAERGWQGGGLRGSEGGDCVCVCFKLGEEGSGMCVNQEEESERRSPGGEVVTAPPPPVAESKDSVTAVFSVELAGFHLLSHVGGEVIGDSERGAKQLGLEDMERFGTAAVGKVTDSRAGTGGHGGPCSVL